MYIILCFFIQLLMSEVGEGRAMKCYIVLNEKSYDANMNDLQALKL